MGKLKRKQRLKWLISKISKISKICYLPHPLTYFKNHTIHVHILEYIFIGQRGPNEKEKTFHPHPFPLMKNYCPKNNICSYYTLFYIYFFGNSFAIIILNLFFIKDLQYFGIHHYLLKQSNIDKCLNFLQVLFVCLLFTLENEWLL